MTGARVCAACRITRPIGSLIAVTSRATGSVRFVCRPSLADQVPGRPPCFGVVGPASVEAIALAADEPRPTELVRHQRADTRRATVAAIAAQTVHA